MIDCERMPPERPLPSGWAERTLPALVSAIEQTEARSRRPWWRSRWTAFGCAAALVAAGGATAGVIVLHQPTQRRSVRCFSTTSLDSGLPASYAALAQPAGSTQQRAPTINDPIGLCATSWQDGLLPRRQDAQPPTRLSRHPLAVPPLVACILQNGDDRGTIGVFPGKAGTCRELGLPPAPGVAPSPASPAQPSIDINNH
jgi:hypothetical protein